MTHDTHQSIGDRLVLLAYRLGLGWLLGRHRLVLTTGTIGGEQLTRTVLPFSWNCGVLSVRCDGDEPWATELSRRPVAMAQAAPGLLAVTSLRTPEGFDLAPTGQPSPPPVMPDLNWVWLVLVVVLVAVRRARSAGAAG